MYYDGDGGELADEHTPPRRPPSASGNHAAIDVDSGQSPHQLAPTRFEPPPRLQVVAPVNYTVLDHPRTKAAAHQRGRTLSGRRVMVGCLWAKVRELAAACDEGAQTEQVR